MGQKSKIEWTDRTWNPVTGCTKVSQGCKNCYAERIYERFNGKGSFKNVQEQRDRLPQPMLWKKPSMVFVNSMSDLFHESLSFVYINAVFSVMSQVDRHIYQVLTKRPERALEFFQWKKEEFGIPWQPKKNVWIGVSVEDQATAASRIPILLQLPVSVRFLSCEPLLGPVDLKHIDADGAGHKEYCQIDALTGRHTDMARPCADVPTVNWVICGGESGPGARPMHPSWARNLQEDCAQAGVPFFFKQWGEWGFHHFDTAPQWLRKISFQSKDEVVGWHTFDDGVCMKRMGKTRAGRMLGGKEYNEMPNFNL